MNKWIYLILFTAVIVPRTSYSQDLVSLYTEVSADNRDRDLVHYSKLTTPIFRGIPLTETYFGVAISGDTLSTQEKIYNDNYIAPLVGLRFSPFTFPIGFLLEARSVIPQTTYSQKPNNELRAGATAGDQYRVKTFADNNFLFSDFYSEGIFSSRLENNFFFMANTKFGYERKWSDLLQTQGYAELYGKRDRLGYYYENLQEARLGIRQKMTTKDLLMGLSLYFAQGAYSGREYKDKNPNPQSYTETAFLFVLGGQL